jgi:T4-like virus tail tube protein gp19
MRASPAGRKTQLAATPINAASYVLNFPSVSVSFSALTGISSVIVPATGTPASGAPTFGQPSPPTVTLQRAADGNTEIWAWYQGALTGNPSARRSGTLVLQDANANTLMSFAMESAWPCGVEVAGAQTGSVQAVIETWTFFCDAIQMQPG